MTKFDEGVALRSLLGALMVFQQQFEGESLFGNRLVELLLPVGVSGCCELPFEGFYLPEYFDFGRGELIVLEYGVAESQVFRGLEICCQVERLPRAGKIVEFPFGHSLADLLFDKLFQ